MKIKALVAGVLAAASFGASAATIISDPVVTDSTFTNVKIGTIAFDSTSNLIGNVFAFDKISAGLWTFSLDSVTFTSATVGSLTDLDGSAAGFSFANVAAGSYDVFASGWLAGNGQYSGLAVLGANYSVTAVPEPATYGMLLGGLGLVGALAARRKNKNAV
jgi:hypothetical protein